MKNTRKEFDAVATMREIRDRLSAQIEGMSFEEEKRFIRKHVSQPKTGRSKEPPNTTYLDSSVKKRHVGPPPFIGSSRSRFRKKPRAKGKNR